MKLQISSVILMAQKELEGVHLITVSARIRNGVNIGIFACVRNVIIYGSETFSRCAMLDKRIKFLQWNLRLDCK